MTEWLGPLLVLFGWMALQLFVLPRLGIPT